MNNVWTIAWRTSCKGLWAPSSGSSSISRNILRHISSSVPAASRSSSPLGRSIGRSVVVSHDAPHHGILAPRICRSTRFVPSFNRSLATRGRREEEANQDHSSKPPADAESTSATRSTTIKLPPLSQRLIASIFDCKQGQISLHVANLTLRELHIRRLTGTLDVDLPEQITRKVSPAQIESALRWLRTTYLVDEDAAIIERIEREDRAEEDRLIEEHMKQGGNVHGKGVFKRMREEREARRVREETERIQREEDEAKGLVEKADKGPKWIVAWTKSNVESMKEEEEKKAAMTPEQRKEYINQQKYGQYMNKPLESAPVMSKSRRIIPCFLFTFSTLVLCAYMAANYEPPPQSTRLFPDIPPAAATLLTLISINTLIFLSWRLVPPAINILNRYFISIPGLPHPLSLLGNVFSHQSLNHLAVNMALLWLIGSRLHDPLGRGAFLAIYISSGVLGSFTSLTTLVLRNNLTSYSLGASGAVSGIIAAFFALHAHDHLTPWFIPESWGWSDWITFPGSTWFLGCIGLELATLFGRGIVKTKIDHYAHLGGYVAGWVGGRWVVEEGMVRRRKQQLQQPRRLFGGESSIIAPYERQRTQMQNRKRDKDWLDYLGFRDGKG